LGALDELLEDPIEVEGHVSDFVEHVDKKRHDPLAREHRLRSGGRGSARFD
jgi:hypothetical protein